MSKKEHVPIRTCVGCRKRKKKGELVWFTQSIGGVVCVNKKKPHQGRGFYLCPDPICFNKARKRIKGLGFYNEC